MLIATIDGGGNCHDVSKPAADEKRLDAEIPRSPATLPAGPATGAATATSRVRGETCAEHAAGRDRKTQRRPFWMIRRKPPRRYNPRLGILQTIMRHRDCPGRSCVLSACAATFSQRMRDVAKRASYRSSRTGPRYVPDVSEDCGGPAGSAGFSGAASVA